MNRYKYKLSLFGRDDKKQAKKPYFHCGCLSGRISKRTKQKTKKERKMLDVIRTYNSSNYKLI